MSEANKQPDQTPGTICWNEIITSDKAASIEFYSNLMGWTTEEMEMPGGMTYTMFKQGDQMIAGYISPAKETFRRCGSATSSLRISMPPRPTRPGSAPRL